MSIDYDQLRELLDEATPGPWLCEEGEYEDEVYIGTGDFGIITEASNETDGRLIALAPDMARELLRLRDGVERYRDAGKALVLANLRNCDENGCSSCSPLANLVDITNRLANLLEGDNE